MDVCVNVMCVRDIAIVINLGIDTTFFFPFNSLYRPHLVIHGQCSHEIETRRGKRKRKKNGLVPRCCPSISIGTVLLFYSERCQHDPTSVRCTTGVWVNKKERRKE